MGCTLVKANVAPTKLAFPWTEFKAVPSHDDYGRVHLCAVVDGLGDVTETSTNDNRLTFRLKNGAGVILDAVAWRVHADATHWVEGETVEIFYAQVNKERKCIEVNSESRVRKSLEGTMRSSGKRSVFLEWPVFMRRKKSL